MQLYFNQTSPYARKARVAVHELGLTAEVRFIEIDPWAEPSDFLAVSPLSKVPALITREGDLVTESDTIVQVLDLLAAPAARLVPVEPQARRGALVRAGLCQGLIDASFIAVIEGRRPAVMRWDDWIGKQRRATERTLGFIEASFERVPDRFDIGDISLACALAYLDLRHANLGWRTGRPRLTEWFEAANARASMRATAPVA